MSADSLGANVRFAATALVGKARAEFHRLGRCRGDHRISQELCEAVDGLLELVADIEQDGHRLSAAQLAEVRRFETILAKSPCGKYGATDALENRSQSPQAVADEQASAPKAGPDANRAAVRQARLHAQAAGDAQALTRCETCGVRLYECDTLPCDTPLCPIPNDGERA